MIFTCFMVFNVIPLILKLGSFKQHTSQKEAGCHFLSMLFLNLLDFKKFELAELEAFLNMA